MRRPTGVRRPQTTQTPAQREARAKNLRRGGPGRPKGQRNHETLEAIAFCRSVVDDPQYRAKTLSKARKGTLSPGIECMLWYYAKGKPVESVALSGVVAVATTVVHEHLIAAPAAPHDLAPVPKILYAADRTNG